MTPDKPEIYYDVPAAEYRQWDAMNYSRLKVLAVSVEQFAYDETHPRKASPAMIFGSAVDCMIHTPTLFETEWVVGGPINEKTGKCYGRDTKAFDAWLQAQPTGLEYISDEDFERATACADAIKAHKRAAELMAAGKPQVCAVWTDKETKVLCKGRLDWLTDKAIPDIKTAEDVEPAGFKRAIYDYGYHIQAALYTDGMAALTGQKRDFIWVVARSQPPHRVKVYKAGPATLAAGRVAYRRGLYQYQLCKKTGLWVDSQGIEEIEMTAYALREEGIEPPQIGQGF